MSKADIEAIEKIQSKVDFDSEQLQQIVNSIVEPYIKDLDGYVGFVRELVTDKDNPPTAQELDDFCMNLSVYIYYASGMQEQLGIKDDIARAIYKEMYHSSRDSLTGGTIADKDSIAELKSQQELITSMLYKRAYSQVKAKVSAAQELLSSCKKVISRRITELEITRIGGNK